jgi:hypothetical protein
MFNIIQLQRVQEHLRDLNHFFGYTGHPELSNETAFYHYDYESNENRVSLKKFREFERCNQKTMAELRQRVDALPKQ